MGYSPILYACRSNNAALIDKLVEFNANISDRGKNGESALHIAAHSGTSAVLSHLLDHFNMSVHLKTDLEITPIAFAVSQKQHDCAKILLDHGSNVNHQGVVSKTEFSSNSLPRC